MSREIDDLARRVAELERTRPRLRLGEVDDATGLDITLGGDDTVLEGVSQLADAELRDDDAVAALATRGAALVLGNVGAPADLGTEFATPCLGEASTAASFANLMAYTGLVIPRRCTLTGLGYWVGGTASGNVRVVLYDSNGDRVGPGNTNYAQSSAGANSWHAMAFNDTIEVEPGVYFAGAVFSSATATWRGGYSMLPSGGVVRPSFTSASSITPPTTRAATAIAMTTY